MLRRAMGVVFLTALMAAFSTAQDEKDKPKEKRPALAVGANVPGVIHAYNVTLAVALNVEPDDGKTKATKYTPRGKYHCPVTEYDLDPVVAIFARGMDDDKAFTGWLNKVHALLDKYQGSRLRGFVVFLYDDLDDIVRSDKEDKDGKDERHLKREELVKKIEVIGNELKRSQLVLTLAAAKDVTKWELDDSPLTVVLYKKLRIEGVYRLSRDKIAEGGAELEQILKDVPTKLKLGK